MYRTAAGAVGMKPDRLADLCATADLLVMRAAPLWVWREEYDRPKRRAYIDVDPGFTQISIANVDPGLSEGIARCDRRFTVGHQVGEPGCPVPSRAGCG